MQPVFVQAVPVHVLPKLEYQLCYGAETLTHTEACQLWAEQQLHSSTVSLIGKIFTQLHVSLVHLFSSHQVVIALHFCQRGLVVMTD